MYMNKETASKLVKITSDQIEVSYFIVPENPLQQIIDIKNPEISLDYQTYKRTNTYKFNIKHVTILL